MRILFLFFITAICHAQSKLNLPIGFTEPIQTELKPFHEFSKGEMEDMLKGEVYATADVNTPAEKIQQLKLFSAGVHPRNCTRAMRKLSLYENYNQYMDFVKESSYNDQTQKISLTIDHTLLPFPMLVQFKIPRIKGEGHYPFVFETGFLKDLKGTVAVKNVGKFCLLGLRADWKGPESKIPNSVFEIFLQTVGKLGLEHLIRVSLF